MTLEILKYPDPRLKTVSKPVADFGKQLHQLLENMAQAMIEADGIGLAAPQVGQFVRAFIIDLSLVEGEEKQRYEFINPEISNLHGRIVFEEGCLSVPGIAEEVQRKSNITVRYQDRHGKFHELSAEDLLAVAIQHENDHLDGILFIDRLPPIKRQWVKRKLAKVVTL